MAKGPLVVSVVNLKGGSGKTTAAVGLACCLSRHGRRVLLMDADQGQHSAYLWSLARQGPPLVDVRKFWGRDLAGTVADAGKGYDAVVIDGPPRADRVTLEAIGAARLALVPVQPSSLDLWAAEDVVKLIQEARTRSRSLAGAFLLNRRPRAKVSEEAAEYLRELPLPLLSASLGQRVSYAEAMSTGRDPAEADPRNAGKELDAVAAEALALVGLNLAL